MVGVYFRGTMPDGKGENSEKGEATFKKGPPGMDKSSAVAIVWGNN